MARARDAFQRAADLMPTFSAAFSNLGATLGELDEPAAALAAFEQALAHDPRSFTILNNIGVVTPRAGPARRIGSGVPARHRDRAGVRVRPLQPRPHAVSRGQVPRRARAPTKRGSGATREKNRRQGCRLAMMRLATGDVAGAERDLWRFADAAPADEREDLLLEAYEIAQRAADAASAAATRAQPAVSSDAASAPNSPNPSKLEPMDTPESAGQPVGRGVGPRSSANWCAIAACGWPPGSPSRSPFRSRSCSTSSSDRLSDLGRSSAVVLRQLSQETADGVTKDVEDALKAPYINVLLRIAQRADRAARSAVHRERVRPSGSSPSRSSTASTSGRT